MTNEIVIGLPCVLVGRDKRVTKNVLNHGLLSDQAQRLFNELANLTPYLGEISEFDLTFPERRVLYSLDSYLTAKRKINQFDSIWVLGNMDGLGDIVHYIRYSRSLAEAYPHAQVIFTTHFPELFDSALLPSNHVIVATKKNQGLTMDTIPYLGTNTLIVNPSAGLPIEPTLFYRKVVEKEDRDLARKISEHYQRINVQLPYNAQWPLTQLTQDDTSETIWGQWNDVINGEIETHQVISQAQKLRYLFGVPIQGETFLPVPLKLPGEKTQRPSDVLIVYDSFSGNGIKGLSIDHWVDVIVRINKENHGTRIISLVRGQDNPAVADVIIERARERSALEGQPLNGDIRDFRGINGFTDFICQLMNTQVLLTVDTGLGHIANELLRLRVPRALQHPRVIALYGRSVFDFGYYRLDCANSLVAPKKADDIPSELIYDQVQRALAGI